MDHRIFDLNSTALRHFVAAAKLRSVRRAAEALHVSASALSRQIAVLEGRLQVSLFERLPRGLKLTSAGDILLLHVEQSFRELGRAFEAIDELKNVRRGHINVALAESAARSLLPTAFTAFWNKHPQLDITLHVLGTFEIIRLLERGDVDLAVAFNVPAEAEMFVASSTRFRLGAVVHRRHELARKRSLQMRDLIGFPLILSDDSRMIHFAFREAMKGLPLHLRVATNSITAMTLLAAADNGIALKTVLGVNEDVNQGTMVFLPLSDRRLPLQRVSVLIRPGMPLPDSVNILASECATALKEVSKKEAALFKAIHARASSSRV